MNLIAELEAEQIASLGKTIPDFKAGDTVRVGYKVTEGTRTRVQAYEGVCIARDGGDHALVVHVGDLIDRGPDSRGVIALLILGMAVINFTNLATSHDRFLSETPRFCASALAGYTPQDFVALVDRAGIGWHEKTQGQLFCDGSTRQIVSMLIDRAQAELTRAVEQSGRFLSSIYEIDYREMTRGTWRRARATSSAT